MAFAIKAEIREPRATRFAFIEQKTMYGGRHIVEGDMLFVFASENQGGKGLIARCTVVSVEAIAAKLGPARQTPRVSLVARRIALATRPLGRIELKPLTDRPDGGPASELHFKLYRQATNKVIGVSEEAAAFLGTFF